MNHKGEQQVIRLRSRMRSEGFIYTKRWIIHIENSVKHQIISSRCIRKECREEFAVIFAQWK